ncbi:MAG: hypothetical protein J5636_03250 [Clostridiales bacterium]|nr:hypothetical protein [Clostridiales bacterium]
MEKKTFVEWVKKHKKELIVAGVSIVALISVIIGIKNRKELEDTWSSLRKLLEKTPESVPVKRMISVTESVPVKAGLEINFVTNNKIPHDVAEHLRNLPEGWKASAEKIATAAEHGYNLLPGQTWVEAYRTRGFVA